MIFLGNQHRKLMKIGLIQGLVLFIKQVQLEGQKQNDIYNFKMNTTVPKLNYAVRSKSKHSSGEVETHQGVSSNDLFSHMNQGNLNYISDQIKIKQKHKKIHLTRNHSPEHPPSISEKDQLLELTSRQLGQQKISEAQRQESEPQSNKISFYDLVSQAKSKRIPSVDGSFQQGYEKGFLEFLSTYIQQLKVKTLKTSRNHGNITKNDKQILVSRIKEEKRKTSVLASELEKHRSAQRENSIKIERLEGVVREMAIALTEVKNELEGIREERKYDGLDIIKGQTNKLSYRGSREELRLKKTKSETEDLMKLEKELRAFNEKGQIQLRKTYDNWRGS